MMVKRRSIFECSFSEVRACFKILIKKTGTFSEEGSGFLNITG
jgi:hypothetical protein